jgi:hypothetical protein
MFNWLKKKKTISNPAVFSFGLPRGFTPPPEETLEASLREIVRTNFLLDRELAPKGLSVSPVWENQNGTAVVRALLAPSQFRERYFVGHGAAALMDPGMARATVGIFPWMSDSPKEAAIVLQDSYKFWCDLEAPTRSLERPFQAHFTLLSLLSADLARKNAAGMDIMEIMASLGIPLDTHDPASDPPIAQIKQSMLAKTEKMHAEEVGWVTGMMIG